jgi:hypothetical protein
MEKLIISVAEFSHSLGQKQPHATQKDSCEKKRGLR